MKFNRESGILMHPTSLQSPYGIGDLGKAAYDFVDFLHQSKQRLWQMLPLGPVGFGESPYQSFSAFAGNTLLISIDGLKEEGLLQEVDLLNPPMFNPKKVQFREVKLYKEQIFRKAYETFKKIENTANYDDFTKRNSKWLRDFTLFMAIKTRFGLKSWSEWDVDIRERRSEAMAYYTKELDDEIKYQEFLQYHFFKQWRALKCYANDRSIKIIGDLPIFISNDSSDVWAGRELFEIDKDGNPIKVAGVPPDFFSTTGQYWGNPHYHWDVMAKDEFKWWRDRFEMLMDMVDIIRIDHFRGFEAYWEIEGKEKTAENGRWIKAPGAKLFKAIEKYLGDLPIIVEDLGIITKEVEELKNEFKFPGMKVLQFSFGKGSEERFLPHHYEASSVVYTGTHDNNTIVGWLESSVIEQPDNIESIKNYFGISADDTINDICWMMIEAAFKCNSNIAIIPMQDILCIGTEARMNIPSTIGNNWGWRFESCEITSQIINKLKEFSTKYDRNK